MVSPEDCGNKDLAYSFVCPLKPILIVQIYFAIEIKQYLILLKQSLCCFGGAWGLTFCPLIQLGFDGVQLSHQSIKVDARCMECLLFGLNGQAVVRFC